MKKLIMILSSLIYSSSYAVELVNDIELSKKINSTPAIYKDKKIEFSIVTTEQDNYDHYSEVNIYDLKGHRVDHLLKGKNFDLKVAPANQVYSADGLKVIKHDDPHKSVLIRQPFKSMINGKPCLVMLSVEENALGSKNELMVTDMDEKPFSGYPAHLSTTPTYQQPIVFENSIYVLLTSNKLERFSGNRLISSIDLSVYGDDPYGYSMNYFESDKRILISTQKNYLVSIDPLNGEAKKLKIDGAVNLSAMTILNDLIYVYDADTGFVLTLKSDGSIVSKSEVGKDLTVYSLQGVQKKNGKTVLVMVSGGDKTQLNAEFERRASKDYKRKVNQAAEESASLMYEDNLVKKNKYKKEMIQELKKGFLEDKIDMYVLAAMNGNQSTVTVIDEGTIFKENFPGFTPETGYSNANYIYPAIYKDDDIYLVVPLNEDDYKSKVRVYKLRDN